MKYHDQQPAAVGDTFVTGTWGQCLITEIDTFGACATVRNTSTGEVFELDRLNEADLISRAARPLAQRITQGPYCRAQVNGGPLKLQTISGKQIAVITDKIHDQREAVANADMMLEAFNVTHETGRTPRQLADERAELIEALSALVETFHCEAPACSPGYTYAARHKLGNAPLPTSHDSEPRTEADL